MIHNDTNRLTTPISKMLFRRKRVILLAFVAYLFTMVFLLPKSDQIENLFFPSLIKDGLMLDEELVLITNENKVDSHVAYQIIKHN